MNKTLGEYQKDIITSAQRGYPILISGSLYFLLLTFAPLLLPQETVSLIWIWGLGVIFPLGILIGRLLRIDLLTQNNPLGTLGGIVAGTQAFYIPIFIVVYQNTPEYLPFTLGLLGGAHFLPYMWIYKSKAYLFVTLGTCLSALILGSIFISYAYTIVPLAISIIYGLGALWILHENKNSKNVKKSS